ncbi:MAG TPA: hypothetical protein VEI03_08790 [Stellaceae bacterium]|nr:hypothetical protein [Stellaceae bacterium]
MQRLVIAAALALAAVSAPLSTRADAPGLVGRWHWNPSQSTSVPGETPPRDVLMVIQSASPARVQWELTIVDSAGARHVQSFSGSGDGKPAPVSGAPQGTTGALTVSATSYEAVYSNPDGSTDRSTCSLSADRQKLTCKGTDNDGKGHSAPYTDVYDRQ